MDNTQSMLTKRPAQEGKKVPQFLIAIAATLTAFTVGTILAWTAPALPQLQSPNSTLPITQEQGSWVGSLAAVGAFLGALPAGSVTDLVGRKLALLSMGIPFIISWLLIVYSSSVYMLYIARLIAGFATGASSAIAPVYIGEIAESSVRGALGSFFQLMITAGILYTYLVGALVSYFWLGVLSGLIPVLFIVAFFQAPETPVYLLRKGRRTEAQRALRLLRGSEYEVDLELNEMQREMDVKSQSNVSFMKLLCKKATLKSLFISLGLMVFQQMSGINAVIFYSVDIFKAAGSTLDPSVCAIIVGVIQVIATYSAMMLVDRAGRRILLLISSSVMAACLGVLGYYFHLQQSGEDVSNLGLIPLGCVAIFIIVFSLGFGPIPWMMTGEIFASEIKGIASSAAVALNWTQTFIITKSFQSLVDGLGSAVTFWLLAGVCVTGFIFTFFFVIETKGKSMEQIQDELAGRISLPKQ
ncbi:facilitated trehalose transporter Tret1-like [Lycorma delicatula]|uniref:facilitated trehalose transporter Tret1-like n=1 Tax=Lycorma delicatula TaxID=130591 RepID=UPI003F50DD72